MTFFKWEKYKITISVLLHYFFHHYLGLVLELEQGIVLKDH